MMNSKDEKKSDRGLITDITAALVWRTDGSHGKCQYGYTSRPISEFEALDYGVRICT
jgi:hypothetical protein